MSMSRKILANRFRPLLLEQCENRCLLAADSGLVAYWPGNGTPRNALGNYDGTLQGNAGYSRGVIGEAFDLRDNSGVVQVANAPDVVLGSSDFSIELWSRIDSRNCGYSAFVSRGEGPGPNRAKWGFVFEGCVNPAGVAEGGLKFHINAPTLGSGEWIGAPFSQTPGTWHQFVITRQGGSLWSIYADGRLIGTATQAIPIPGAQAPWLIGGFDGGSSLDGVIDELKVYNRALAAAEIQSAYQVIADAAIAVSDIYQTAQENVLLVPAPGVLANDNAALSATLAHATEHGALVLKPDGSFLYTPNNGFLGRDSFTYRPSELSSQIATVYIDVTVPVAKPLPSDAIAWWKGEGNANDSIGANHGVLRGTTGYGAGKVGQAFSLDGGGDGDGIGGNIEVPDSDIWALGEGDFTINLWAKFSAFSNAGLGIVSGFLGQFETTSAANNWSFFVEGGGNFHIGAGPGNGVIVRHAVSLGVWYNLSLTKTGSTYAYYLDGTLLNSLA